MDDRPRIILKDLIGRYGISLAADPVRTEGLLRDTCGTCHREIFVLVNAIRQKVPGDLLSPRHSLPVALLREFLARRLRDELSLSEEASRWAVESWAEALGVTGSAQKNEPEHKQSRPEKVSCSTAPEDPAVISLREQWADDLESSGLETRLQAVRNLCRTPDSGNIRILIGALENGNWQVRNAAFDALSELGKNTVPALCEALGDTSDEILWRASLLLGTLRAREAVDPLVHLLDRKGVIRECAIWSLGEIGDENVSTVLLKFIDADDPVIRQEACTALKKIGDARKRNIPDD